MMHFLFPSLPPSLYDWKILGNSRQASYCGVYCNVGNCMSHQHDSCTRLGSLCTLGQEWFGRFVQVWLPSRVAAREQKKNPSGPFLLPLVFPSPIRSLPVSLKEIQRLMAQMRTCVWNCASSLSSSPGCQQSPSCKTMVSS